MDHELARDVMAHGLERLYFRWIDKPSEVQNYLTNKGMMDICNKVLDDENERERELQAYREIIFFTSLVGYKPYNI